MTRLFLLWKRPAGSSRDDAHTWAQRWVWSLRQAEGVESAQLVLLTSAGVSYPLWHEWLLDVHLADGVALDRITERDPVLREFIAELRSLGMRPVVLREADGGGID